MNRCAHFLIFVHNIQSTELENLPYCETTSNMSAQLGQLEAHLNPIFTELQTLFTDLLPQSNKFQPDSQSFYACHRRIGELKTQLFAALPRTTSMNTLLCEKRKGLLTGVTNFTVTKISFPPKLFLNNMSYCVFFLCADMRRRVNQLREPKKHPSLNVDIPSNDVRFFCFNLTLNLKKSRSLISSALITIPFVSNEYLMQLCILLEDLSVVDISDITARLGRNKSR